MKKKADYLLVVDVDPRRHVPVVMTHAYRAGDEIIPSEKPNKAYNKVTDMAKLCEAICLMMHLEDKEGKQKDYTSLEMCIEHLNKAQKETYYPNFDKISNDAFLVDTVFDTANKEVNIVHLNRTYSDASETEEGSDNVKTMYNLCEALLMLIFIADDCSEKPKSDALADCINHLESGFKDPSYKAHSSTTTNW